MLSERPPPTERAGYDARTRNRRTPNEYKKRCSCSARPVFRISHMRTKIARSRRGPCVSLTHDGGRLILLQSFHIILQSFPTPLPATRASYDYFSPPPALHTTTSHSHFIRRGDCHLRGRGIGRRGPSWTNCSSCSHTRSSSSRRALLR